MRQTLESVWEDGFLKEKTSLTPKLNNLYNQKSIHFMSKTLRRFRIEVWMLIPMALAMFILNLALDNDNSIFWGIICALPCLLWFYIGIKQFNSLKDISYGSSCYEYLISVKQKLNGITTFNKRLSILSVLITLFPMLLYTYFNNQEKTIGEIFGIESLNWSNLTLFLLLPMGAILAFIFVEMVFKQTDGRRDQKIDFLIKEMEQLRG
jgi:hypothetical protein